MRTNLVNLATIAIIAKVSTIIAGYFQANLIFAKQPHIENEKLNYTKLFDDTCSPLNSPIIVCVIE